MHGQASPEDPTPPTGAQMPVNGFAIFQLTQAEEATASPDPDLASLCSCLSHLLARSSLAAGYLPLKENNVFDRLQDGVVLCAIAKALPFAVGTLDESDVYRGADLTHAELGELRCQQNLNLAMKSLELLGVYTAEVQARDFRPGSARPSLMCGILLQVVRVIPLRRMCESYYWYVASYYIVEEWTSAEALKQLDAMSQEEALIRWVNYQLRKAGTHLVMENFGPSLADSAIYATLLETVAPPGKRSSLQSVDSIMAVKDPVLRATSVVKNAEILGISGAITPEMIASAGSSGRPLESLRSVRNCTFNLAFLGRILAMYPCLELPTMAAIQRSTQLDPIDYVRDIDESLDTEYEHRKRNAVYEDLVVNTKCNQDTNKERVEGQTAADGTDVKLVVSPAWDSRRETATLWLNSFGVNPTVKNLKTDLCSGIVLLQVWQALDPAYTKWSKFYKVNDPNIEKRKFQWLANCSAVMDCAKQHGIQVNCCASDIATGETKDTLALVFLMMRFHSKLRRRQACGSVGDLDDADLVKWANGRLIEFGSSFQLKDLSDPGLISTNVLSFLGERVLVETGRFRNVPASSQGGGGGSSGSSGKAPTPPPPERTDEAASESSSSRSCSKTLVPADPADPASSTSVNQRSQHRPPGQRDTGERGSIVSQSLSGTSRDTLVATSATDGCKQAGRKSDKPGRWLDSNANASAANDTWLFDSVQSLPGETDKLARYSAAAVAMFRRGGVSIFTRLLGPSTDASVHADVLLQLNAFCCCRACGGGGN